MTAASATSDTPGPLPNGTRYPLRSRRSTELSKPFEMWPLRTAVVSTQSGTGRVSMPSPFSAASKRVCAGLSKKGGRVPSALPETFIKVSARS